MWQLENDVVAVGQEISKASQHLESLGLITEALDEKIARSNKLLTTIQAKMSSFVTLIAQKQASIATCNKKIYQIAAKTGVRHFKGLFFLPRNNLKISGLKSHAAFVIYVPPFLA